MWPMLGLRWTPAATFALAVLADVEDEVGFLPGSGLNLEQYVDLDAHRRTRAAITTSYHTMYVAGMLWSCALRGERRPPARVSGARSARGAAPDLMRLLLAHPTRARWHRVGRLVAAELTCGRTSDELRRTRTENTCDVRVPVMLRRLRSTLGDVRVRARFVAPRSQSTSAIPRRARGRSLPILSLEPERLLYPKGQVVHGY
jgi:Domain of unknown function (DUF6895)